MEKMISYTMRPNCDFEAITKYKETFSAMLKHDLKTPTIAQIRSLELVLSGALGELNEQQNDLLTQTLESCRCMYDMINSALNTYKYQDCELTLLSKKFDFYELAKNCCVELAKIASAKGQCINLKCTTNKTIINADKKQIKYAIINLLSECISRGYENSKIEVLIEHTKNKIVFGINIKCSDIAPYVLDKIFESAPEGLAKFNIIGTSLRLPLVYKIVSAHHGLMYAVSNGGMTSFSFFLPYLN